MGSETNVIGVPKDEQINLSIDRIKLKQELDWLEARVDKEEQQLEELMQKIFTEEDIERKTELETKMKNNKGLVETARNGWEQAAAAYLNETTDGNEKAASAISKANKALLQVLE